MKARHLSLRPHLLLLIILIIGLLGCSKEEFSPEVTDSSPSLQSLIDDPSTTIRLDSINTGCSGTRTFSVPYSIVPTDSFVGYDWAIQINAADATGPYDVEEPCFCKIDFYCITIKFPQTYVGGAAVYSVQNGEATMHPVDIDGNGGYYTPFYNKGNTGGNPQVHRICMAPADLLTSLFQLPFGFPMGYDMNNAVITVSGICTVDNLPTPMG